MPPAWARGDPRAPATRRPAPADRPRRARRSGADHHRHLLRRGPEDLAGREIGDLVDIVGHVLDGGRPALDAQAGRLAILDAREVARARAPDVAGALALLAAQIGDHGRDEFRFDL